jgi:hypothetical protein
MRDLPPPNPTPSPFSAPAPAGRPADLAPPVPARRALPVQVPIRAVPERHHWIATIVGILDQAFHLTDDEQVFALGFVDRFLESLRIPDRADPSALPVSLVLEMSAGIYSEQLSSSASSSPRRVRHVGPGDVVVSLETWREAMLSLIVSAYPELSPPERLMAAKMLADLLDAIGVPDRAAAFVPDDVVRVSRDVDADRLW